LDRNAKLNFVIQVGPFEGALIVDLYNWVHSYYARSITWRHSQAERLQSQVIEFCGAALIARRQFERRPRLRKASLPLRRRSGLGPNLGTTECRGEVFVCLSMRFCPLSPGLFPRELPAFLSVGPLIRTDFLLNEIRDAIERVRVKVRWHRYVFLDFQNLAHRTLSSSLRAITSNIFVT
jgi:hypothetical protein